MAGRFAALVARARLRSALVPELFDVFLCRNRKDKAVVERIAGWLQEEGLRPWLDQWRIAPGDLWQSALFKGLDDSKACIAFVGPHGLNSWAREELARAQDRAVNDCGFPPVHGAAARCRRA
ncbi:MAG: toll/interleukin-1 receptor domain-containing protein [Egibacteraceae bacterium]